LQAGGDVRALVVVALGDGAEVLVSGGPRAPLRVWDTRRRTLLRELGDALMMVTVLAAADGLLVAGEASGTIRVWRVGVDPAGGRGGGGNGVTWEQEVVLIRAHSQSVRALSIRHGRLLSGSDDGVVTVWSQR
jgi:WD40 repeat protein